MSALGRLRLADLCAAALTLVFALACALFVRQPGLGTFADDSVSYLVMAQVFSPWQPASQAVSEAFARDATYPPLFALVLALAGAAHSIAWAHVLTALILTACLPALYALSLRSLDSRAAAAAVVLAVALMPAMWINARGILSEPLFALLFLATMLVLDSARARPWVVALLLAAMLLTRTAALAPIAGYGAWAAARRGLDPAARGKAVLPALAAIVAHAAWVLLRPAAGEDTYARILDDHAAAFAAAADPWSAVAASVARQANAMAEAWLGSLLVFWVEGRPVRTALAAAVGVLALAGLALRAAAGKADAWMVGAYLVLFLVWPFYDQMGRFLFPVLPVLALYAFVAAGRALLAARKTPALGHALLAFLALSLTLPALGFIYQRASAGGPYAGIVDWYRTPGLAEARSRAQVHLDLFADMEAIGALTRPGERVMWVVPAYVALLAGRGGVKAPDASLPIDRFREAVRGSGADYVFLSRFHPRDTLGDSAWQAGLRALVYGANPLHARVRADGTVTAVLLRSPR